MAVILSPASAVEAQDMVREAIAARAPLEIAGHGSRRNLGHPVEAEAKLDMSRLSRIVNYEPRELVLTVEAGTPMPEIETLLAGERQRLAFEPPEFSALWGLPTGRGTVGGMISAGFGGSRRLTAGGPRDHFLGFQGINGFGEAFAAGGRVVKNVTGFDLPKLLAGAFGTLGVLTELTIKVLPAPEVVVTIVLADCDEDSGLHMLRTVMAGPVAVTGAAFLSGEMSTMLPGLSSLAGRSATLLRIEGTAASIPATCAKLLQIGRASRFDRIVLEGLEALALWRAIGCAYPLASAAGAVWRVSLPPARAHAFGEALRREGIRDFYFDWAGGLAWVAQGRDGARASVRGLLAETAGEGHATLVRWTGDRRDQPAVFEPPESVLAALCARVRAQFDPLRLFNPGRMGPSDT